MTRASGVLAGAALVMLVGCAKEEAQPKPKPEPAGYPSPPLAELVEAATSQGAPKDPSVGYTPPARVVVPELIPPDLSALPKDEDGRPIVVEQLGVRLRVNTDLRDPVTAMSACGNRVAACVQPKDQAGGRSIDACWMSIPRCQTNQPWQEPAGCCSPRCPELYEALRQRGYSDKEAMLLTMRSDCFHGIREFMTEEP